MSYRRGHVKGTRPQKAHASDWYRTIAATRLHTVEATWASQPHTPRAYAAMALACGSPLDLSNATQAELDALVREYLTTVAALGAN